MTQPEWMQIITAEELNNIKGHDYTGLLIEYPNALPILLEAQCEKASRAIAEWLAQLCITPNHIQCGLRRGCCPECIEQFRREVGL